MFFGKLNDLFYLNISLICYRVQYSDYSLYKALPLILFVSTPPNVLKLILKNSRASDRKLVTWNQTIVEYSMNEKCFFYYYYRHAIKNIIRTLKIFTVIYSLYKNFTLSFSSKFTFDM